MKTMTKRIAGVALVVMMAIAVLANAVPTKAFATGENATLTVESSNAAFAGKTVKAWKMFDAKANADGSGATYTLTADWEEFFKSLDGSMSSLAGDPLSQRAYEYVKGLDSNPAKKNTFARKAVEWGTTKPISPTKTSAGAVQAGDKYQATFTGLDFGYYVMSPDVAGTNVERDAMLVNVIKQNEDTVILKSVFPTVDKTVENENHASAQVGDKVTFALTSKLPDATGYDTYAFKFKDELSAGLTFVDGSVTVEIEGEQNAVDPAQYKVEHKTGNLTIELSDYLTNYQKYVGKKITVTYEALINENAVVLDQDNPNKATVEYSNDPTTGQTGTSNPSIVHTYTFGFDIDKVDGTNAQTKLEGAVFELQTAGGVKIPLVKVQEGVFRPAKKGEMAVADDEVKTNAQGKLQFVGLKEGTYQLVETVAPDGYNKVAAPIKVIISAAYHPDGTLDQWKADIEGGGAQDGTHQIQVENNKGALLPETGGMGTAIFTVAGVAIIAGGIAWKRSRRAGNDA
ncbi:MAG: SpaH/EbpB family LPXTG-anchored major pilin [Collinsella intestinalis]